MLLFFKFFGEGFRNITFVGENSRDSFTLSREIPYWQAVEKKMLEMETSDGKDYDRKFSLLNVSLDEAATEKFLSAKLSIYNLEVNDLLLASVGRSYRKHFGKDSVSIQMEGHGRENIGAELFTDRTIGWFTSIYPPRRKTPAFRHGDISRTLFLKFHMIKWVWR